MSPPYENPYAPERTFEGDPQTAAEARMVDPVVDTLWRYWRDEINAGLAAEERWRQEARAAEEEFFGSHEAHILLGPKAVRGGDGRTFTVHANIRTLQPLIYSQTPEPIVRRRFRDGKSDAKDAMVAEVAQRLAQAIMDMTDFDGAMEEVRDHWLIAGRGRPRVMYRAEFGMTQQPHPITGMPVEVEAKTDERVEVTGWNWRRLLLAPAERWRDVRWTAYETFLTRKDVEAHPKMGPEVAAKLRYTIHGLGKHDRITGIEDSDELTGWERDDRQRTGARVPSTHAQAIVWEIWDKTERRVIWWSPDYVEGLVGECEDPLNLQGFFDGPAPLLATTAGGSMAPRPDVAFYIEHVKEIDLASKKMRGLLWIISVSALYAGEHSAEFKKLLDGQNSMVAIRDWMAFAQKGGMSKLIEWLPLQPIIAAAQALVMMREQSKAMVYEITGLSDIVRGAGDPNATATQEGIKGRYAGLRLSERQARFASMARETITMMLEIALEHFDVERIAAMTAIDLPMTEAELQQIMQQAAMLQQAAAMHQQLQQATQAGDMQTANGLAMQLIQVGLDPSQAPPAPPEIPVTSWEAVMGTLRDDLRRSYTVQTETDATILTDEVDDRQLRVEFLGTMANVAASVASLPGLGADFRLVKELLLFAVRGFRKARHLEHLIASMPDEAPEAPEPMEMQLAKIKGEIEKLIAQDRNATAIEVAKINSFTDLKEQELENAGDLAKAQHDAAQRAQDRVHNQRMKGADLQARAAEMGTR